MSPCFLVKKMPLRESHDSHSKVHLVEQKTLTSNPLPAYDNKNQELRE